MGKEIFIENGFESLERYYQLINYLHTIQEINGVAFGRAVAFVYPTHDEREYQERILGFILPQTLNNERHSKYIVLTKDIPPIFELSSVYNGVTLEEQYGPNLHPLTYFNEFGYNPSLRERFSSDPRVIVRDCSEETLNAFDAAVTSEAYDIMRKYSQKRKPHAVKRVFHTIGKKIF